MDGQHIDRIALLLAKGMSRRGAIKAVLGGVVVGTLVPLAGRPAGASACANNCDCPANSRCDNGTCTTGKLCRDRTYKKFCKFDGGSSGCIDPRSDTCPNGCAA